MLNSRTVATSIALPSFWLATLPLTLCCAHAAVTTITNIHIEKYRFI
jgi:hypothetical protein